MGAVWPSFFLTVVSTTVWWNFTVVLWVFILATEAVVLRHWFIVFILTLWAAPVQHLCLFGVLITVQDPLLDASEVHELVALSATPDGLSMLHYLRADYAVLVVSRRLLFLDVCFGFG